MFLHTHPDFELNFELNMIIIKKIIDKNNEILKIQRD